MSNIYILGYFKYVIFHIIVMYIFDHVDFNRLISAALFCI